MPGASVLLSRARAPSRQRQTIGWPPVVTFLNNDRNSNVNSTAARAYLLHRLAHHIGQHIEAACGGQAARASQSCSSTPRHTSLSAPRRACPLSRRNGMQRRPCYQPQAWMLRGAACSIAADQHASCNPFRTNSHAHRKRQQLPAALQHAGHRALWHAHAFHTVEHKRSKTASIHPPRCGMPITTLSTPSSAPRSISAFMPGISASQPSRPKLGGGREAGKEGKWAREGRPKWGRAVAALRARAAQAAAACPEQTAPPSSARRPKADAQPAL